MNEQIQNLLMKGEPIAALQMGICTLFMRLAKALNEEVSPNLVVKYDDLMTRQEGTVSLVLSDGSVEPSGSLSADHRPRIELGRYTTSGLDGLRFQAVTLAGLSKQGTLVADVPAFERALMEAMSQAHVAAWLVRVKQAPVLVTDAASSEDEGSTPSDE